ncbi:hypothetical protein [Xanthobacter dioxanivorans]|uniref:hypothetical protein n=1 Tax=Xanthobacter dioxanivorans TaxID=2528964 RepID=UPI0038CD7CC2
MLDRRALLFRQPIMAGEHLRQQALAHAMRPALDSQIACRAIPASRRMSSRVVKRAGILSPVAKSSALALDAQEVRALEDARHQLLEVPASST